jgi:citrate lyase subunit beta / citryl-CoA lyase
MSAAGQPWFLRSGLFVPGNRSNMLEKALATTADAIVPDMEDSVPEAEKTRARELVASFLPRLRATGKIVMPRVNDLSGGRTAEDLAAVVGPDVDAVSIGKVASPTDISELSLMIGKLEEARGIDRGHIKIIPWLETAAAIVHCYAICTASKRIVAVAFGAEDFTNDLGVERLEDETQVLYARSTVCIAARAAGVLALDTPYFRFKDIEGLRAHSLESRNLGFKGRFAIHPAQTDTINACYAPTAAEIEHARRVVAAFEEAERRGSASTSLEGLVIDVPVVKRARGLLALAERAGGTSD